MQIKVVRGGWVGLPVRSIQVELEFQPDSPLEHERLAALLTAEKLVMVILDPVHENDVLRVRFTIPQVAPVEAARQLSVEELELSPVQAQQAEALDPNRCAVCGWPLVETIDLGCVRGNCSLRQRPATLYDPARAEAESPAPGLGRRLRDFFTTTT